MSQPRLLDLVHVDNVGVDVELELLALGGGLAGVLGVEDGIEFLELVGCQSCGRIGSGGAGINILCGSWSRGRGTR